MARFSGSSGSGIPANISESELLTLDGVVSAIQTQIDGKQAVVANVSNTEIGYLDGVTSAIQTQIDTKLATATAASTYQAINANVSTTELGYLDGVTSAIQTQLDAKIAKTLTSTTGDIIYASGANTPARLGIGSSAQVLTVSGGVPSWATPASGSFIGAFAYSTTPQTLGNNSRVAQNLQAELYDTNTFHDNTTDNSRMTIPSGQGGKYFIGAMVSFTNNVTGYRSTSIRKNGLDAVEFYGFNAGAAGGGPFGSTILDLIATDYIEVYGRQGSGGNLDTATDAYTGGQSGVFLFIQKVG